MKRYKQFRPLALVTTAMLILGSCSTSAPPPQGDSPGSAPARGGKVVIGLFPGGMTIDSLQPILSTRADGPFTSFYLPLLGIDPDTGDAIPALAERFEASAGFRTLTYMLRAGLEWSDGSPFTGEDYRYTVEALARSKAGVRKTEFRNITGYDDYASGRVDAISGITVSSDGRTITVQLAQVSCGALREIASAGGGVLPRHLFVAGWNNKTTDVSKTIDTHPMNERPPASIGPWVLKDYRPGIELVATANDKFFRGKPLLDEVIFRFYADENALATGIIAGEAHLGTGPPRIAEQVNKSGNPNVEGKSVPGVGNYFYIGWNQRSPKAPWLAAKEVRQALSYGVDRKRIVDALQFGYGSAAYTHIPPSSTFFDGTGLNRYEFDRTKAKQLLERAGATMAADGVYRWIDGTPMSMRLETIPPLQLTAQAIQETYRDIGIKLEVLTMPPPALFPRMDPANVDREGTLWLNGVGPDPGGWELFHSSQTGRGQMNRFFYSNPDADRALDAVRFGPDCSLAARKRAYSTFNRIVNEDAPYTFVFVADPTYSTQKSLQGLVLKPYAWSQGLSYAPDVEKWWLKR